MSQFKNAYEYLLQLPEKQSRGHGPMVGRPLLDSVMPAVAGLRVNLGDNPFGELYNSQCAEELVAEEELQRESGKKPLFNQVQIASEIRSGVPESTRSFESTQRNLLSLLELQGQKVQHQDPGEGDFLVVLRVKTLPLSLLETLKALGHVEEVRRGGSKQQQQQQQPQSPQSVPSLQVPAFSRQSLLSKKTNQESSRELSGERGAPLLRPALLQKASPFRNKNSSAVSSGVEGKRGSFHIFKQTRH